MSFTRTMRWRAAAGGIAGLAAAASIAVVVTPGHSQQTVGRTLIITPVGKETLAFKDVKPAGFRRNRFSLGDQLILTTKITRDHTVLGTEQATITVSDPRPVDGARAHGVVSAVYHLADGDIYSVGTVTLDAAETGGGAVIGGTGAYAGARGTIEPGHDRDVVHLLP